MKRLLIALILLGALRVEAQTSTAATAAVKISQAASTFGTVTLTSDVAGVLPVANGGTGTGSACTATYVLFATTSGVQSCTAGFTFATAKLTVPNLVDSGLTITRVPYASTDGLLIDKATFTFTTATNTLLTGSVLTADNGSVKSPHFFGMNGAGGAPTVAGTTAAACGTTAPSIAGTDEAATITVGSVAGTSCTVTFGTAWSVNTPACVASQNGTSTVASVAPTLTNMVIAGTFVAGDKIAYICRGF